MGWSVMLTDVIAVLLVLWEKIRFVVANASEFSLLDLYAFFRQDRAIS